MGDHRVIPGFVNVKHPDGKGSFSRVSEDAFARGGFERWPDDAPAPPPPAAPSGKPGPEKGTSAEYAFQGRALEIVEAAVQLGIIAEASIEAVAAIEPHQLSDAIQGVGDRTASNLVNEARRRIGRR